MSANAKISGSWKDVSDIQCKVSSTWIPIDAGYAKVSGTWQQFYSANMQATGGNITDVGGFRYHTFTSSGTFEVTANPKEVQYLVVAGGGGGGGTQSFPTGGGGGGAGGYLATTLSTSINTFSVVVGAGGAGGDGEVGTSAGRGLPGSNSSFSTSTSIGGGGGGFIGFDGNDGTSGGSGGGGAGSAAQGSGGSGTSGQGNAGGNGFGGTGAVRSGGGGGGASATGQNASSGTGGNGGAGDTWLNGNDYSGGGGGGTADTEVAGTGGTGGGGNGGANEQDGENGLANTGGGAGGAGEISSERRVGGNGGSGVVVIRYPYTLNQSSIYSVTDTHGFVTHSSTTVSRTMTLDSNTNREIWLALFTIGGLNNQSSPTVTIGGNPMTEIVNQGTGSTSIRFFRYGDAGSLGTSAVIETVYNFSSTHTGYVVFTAEPTSSTVDSYSAGASGSNPANGTLTTSSTGWSFYIATAQNSTAATSIPNFGDAGFFDYGTGENIAYGYNSPENTGTVSVEFANFTNATDENLMLAISRGV